VKSFLCALFIGIIAMVTVLFAGAPSWAGTATAIIVFNIWHAHWIKEE
jgi:hypothetical protein